VKNSPVALAISLLGISVFAAGTLASTPVEAATRMSASALVRNTAPHVPSGKSAKPLYEWSQKGAAPLNHPWGMSLDAQGNLYVANQGANQVLKYGPNLNQLTCCTITAGLAAPTAVAFDSKKNLYVSNTANSTITEYSMPSGAQITSRTLANGISAPKWIAIDGVDDIWVNNGFQSVNVYSADETFIKTLPLSHPGGIAVQGGYLDIGSGQNELNMVLQQFLVSNNQIGTFYQGSDLIGTCYDSNGNNWYTDAGTDGVIFTNHAADSSVTIATTSFDPDGIAVDLAHNHVFVGGWSTNQIAVYNTAGTLLTVIH
jgi:sugar lactone lactonase YvrE